MMNDGFLSAAVLILFLNDRRSVTFPMLRLLDDRCAVPINGLTLVRLSDCDASAHWTGLSANTPYYWRSAARSVPDNMYANVVKLRAYAASQGQDWRYGNASLPIQLSRG